MVSTDRFQSILGMNGPLGKVAVSSAMSVCGLYKMNRVFRPIDDL